MNTREYREKLIDEVKKYPVLYDTRHENHRDIDVRDRCWMEISERFGANCEILKREWKILRDSLRQSLKKCNKGATTKAGVPCKKWRFQNRMAFVLPYMTKRRSPRALRDLKRDEAEAPEPEAPEPPEADEADWEPGGDHDALDLFFASVCQSAKRLPRRLHRGLKRDVLDALLRAEEQHEADQRDCKEAVSKLY
ncbi:uncharacterized protein LOC112052252 [Bicyclus anynana]|uniref:Uncharacterized protein LOC112052252 n=1 Tax=Bicyclus anynana TaxID=110368 RepID=A0A6J1NUJ0_BICAN|nr:uncharacterized protein LOC112052252 [Bicyclus anynana]